MVIRLAVLKSATSTFNNLKSSENIEISYRIDDGFDPVKRNIYMNHFVLNNNGETIFQSWFLRKMAAILVGQGREYQ